MCPDERGAYVIRYLPLAYIIIGESGWNIRRDFSRS